MSDIIDPNGTLIDQIRSILLNNNEVDVNPATPRVITDKVAEPDNPEGDFVALVFDQLGWNTEITPFDR
ncbi:hypothetical protein ACL02T_12945 [Pseudonocardia sp. RS010]|uniref:hypothetical protein n=1 Tax=Pseudonocardia sp. RS010 TaxID=3385979 RepID=UPI0039A05D00